ncbi:hypothetical protein H4219_002248 [Mycoemilia scoparia]|uniref:Amino acid transporter transmembrane domain-containing protein n=1 Tax=Mycoemilia scoparia TaxID=417184 RepID=A0A9W8A7D5_9FUNG|nr:hypothetical protein H4219_002248 [Mycoemilia scoparia]
MVSRPSSIKSSRESIFSLDLGTLTAFQASFLILNTAIGSGIFGLPWAISRAGLVYGVFIIVFVAILNLFANFILLGCGIQTKTYQFEDLSRKALGRFGTLMIQFAIIVNGFGCCISYLLIIGDTMTPVMSAMAGPSPYINRNTVITGFALIIIFPLLFFKNIAPLSKPSALSIFCIPIIMLFVIVKGIDCQHKNPTQVVWFGDDLFSSIGLISFAFGSTQTSFQSFSSLRHQTFPQWKITATVAASSMLVIYSSFGLAGYLSFGSIVQTNILNNFAIDDPWANFSRILMAISILLTYPMQFYPLRELVTKKLHLRLGQSVFQSAKIHSMSVVFFAVTLAISLSVNDLGLVYQLVGTCSATLLSFLLPSTIYFALNTSWPRVRHFWRHTVTRAEHGETAPITSGINGTNNYSTHQDSNPTASSINGNDDDLSDDLSAIPEHSISGVRYTIASFFMFVLGVVVFFIGTYTALRNKFSPKHK